MLKEIGTYFLVSLIVFYAVVGGSITLIDISINRKWNDIMRRGGRDD